MGFKMWCRLPGLLLRPVAGRGHGIEEWEAHIVNDLLKAFAPYAYAKRARFQLHFDSFSTRFRLFEVRRDAAVERRRGV